MLKITNLKQTKIYTLQYLITIVTITNLPTPPKILSKCYYYHLLFWVMDVCKPTYKKTELVLTDSL